MTTTRRVFLKTTAIAGATTLALPWSERVLAGERLRVLVLGGTGQTGPHLVGQLLDRGHAVTLFNRGKTNTHLFPDLEKIRGDREQGIGHRLVPDRTIVDELLHHRPAEEADHPGGLLGENHPQPRETQPEEDDPAAVEKGPEENHCAQ